MDNAYALPAALNMDKRLVVIADIFTVSGRTEHSPTLCRGSRSTAEVAHRSE